MDKIVPTKLSELPFKVIEETDKYVVLQIGRIEFVRCSITMFDLTFILKGFAFMAWRDVASDSYFLRIEKPSGINKIT